MAQAVELAGCYPADSGPPSPHWRVIERITTAEVLARSGDQHTAEILLTAAISDAETLRLPHQVQRIIRLASEPGVLAEQTVPAGAGSPHTPGQPTCRHGPTDRL